MTTPQDEIPAHCFDEARKRLYGFYTTQVSILELARALSEPALPKPVEPALLCWRAMMADEFRASREHYLSGRLDRTAADAELDQFRFALTWASENPEAHAIASAAVKAHHERPKQ